MDSKAQTEHVQPPVTPGSPRPSTVAAVLIILVGLAILKPWPPGVPDAGHQPAATHPSTPSPAPTATATPDLDRARVTSFCLEPSGWRLFSTELWADRQVRGWKSIDPADAADGPGDDRIPLFPQASRATLTLGFCAPISGPDRPPPATTVAIYQQVPAGSGSSERTWSRIAPPQVYPVDGTSAVGGAWGPPRDAEQAADPTTKPRRWPSGTYVFGITGARGNGFERWFGVIVEVLPPLAP